MNEGAMVATAQSMLIENVCKQNERVAAYRDDFISQLISLLLEHFHTAISTTIAYIDPVRMSF